MKEVGVLGAIGILVIGGVIGFSLGFAYAMWYATCNCKEWKRWWESKS